MRVRAIKKKKEHGRLFFMLWIRGGLLIKRSWKLLTQVLVKLELNRPNTMTNLFQSFSLEKSDRHTKKWPNRSVDWIFGRPQNNKKRKKAMASIFVDSHFGFEVAIIFSQWYKTCRLVCCWTGVRSRHPNKSLYTWCVYIGVVYMDDMPPRFTRISQRFGSKSIYFWTFFLVPFIWSFPSRSMTVV